MAQEQWLTPEQLHTWVKLESITELLPGALDQPLQRAHGINHFDYIVLSQLSEAVDRTMPMTVLAARSSATLPRLSHVIRRLEARGLIERRPSDVDRRVTLAKLTAKGWQLVVEAAPTHVASVRKIVIDRLTPPQLAALADITDAILRGLDPGDRRGLLTACRDKATPPDNTDGAGQ